MLRATVAVVVRRSSDRDELRAAMKTCRQINLISVAANGDSIRSGSISAEVVVLDPFASDAETLHRFLREHAPKTKVIVLARSLRSIAALSIPPELVAIQAFDESFESVIVRFLRDGADRTSENSDDASAPDLGVADRPGSTSARSAAQRSSDAQTDADAEPGRSRPRSLASIPALGLPDSTRPQTAPETEPPHGKPPHGRLPETHLDRLRNHPNRIPAGRIRPDQAVWEPQEDKSDLKAVTQAKPIRSGSAKVVVSAASSSQVRSIVVLGASTGGPEAVRTVLGGLPASFPLPILVVQHMPALFTEQFAASLNETVPLKVAEATDGTQPRPGEVWVAPGGFHMEITDLSGRITLSKGPKLHGCRPAVDVLFKSASRLYGPQVLAVVLTGMGHDGADGCQEVAAAGGHVIVQDEATSTVWGMPGSVAKRGVANQIVPLKQVAFTIVGNAAAGRARVAARTSSWHGAPQAEVSQ